MCCKYKIHMDYENLAWKNNVDLINNFYINYTLKC